MKCDRSNFRAFDPAGCDTLPQGARTTISHLDGVTLAVERKTWDFHFLCELEVGHLIAKKRHQFFAVVGEQFARLKVNNILSLDINIEPMIYRGYGFQMSWLWYIDPDSTATTDTHGSTSDTYGRWNIASQRGSWQLRTRRLRHPTNGRHDDDDSELDDT